MSIPENSCDSREQRMEFLAEQWRNSYVIAAFKRDEALKALRHVLSMVDASKEDIQAFVYSVLHRLEDG